MAHRPAPRRATGDAALLTITPDRVEIADAGGPIFEATRAEWTADPALLPRVVEYLTLATLQGPAALRARLATTGATWTCPMCGTTLPVPDHAAHTAAPLTCLQLHADHLDDLLAAAPLPPERGAAPPDLSTWLTSRYGPWRERVRAFYAAVEGIPPAYAA